MLESQQMSQESVPLSIADRIDPLLTISTQDRDCMYIEEAIEAKQSPLNGLHDLPMQMPKQYQSKQPEPLLDQHVHDKFQTERFQSDRAQTNQAQSANIYHR